MILKHRKYLSSHYRTVIYHSVIYLTPHFDTYSRIHLLPLTNQSHQGRDVLGKNCLKCIKQKHLAKFPAVLKNANPLANGRFTIFVSLEDLIMSQSVLAWEVKRIAQKRFSLEGYVKCDYYMLFDSRLVWGSDRLYWNLICQEQVFLLICWSSYIPIRRPATMFMWFYWFEYSEKHSVRSENTPKIIFYED